MPLTDAGALAIAKLLIGDAQTLFNLANAKIGTGNGTAAFAKTQTDLQGANKFRKPIDTGFPVRTGATLQFRATFSTSEGNYPAAPTAGWQEWGVFNAAPTGGDMLNRKVENLGVKDSSQSWQFTVDLVIQA